MPSSRFCVSNCGNVRVRFASWCQPGAGRRAQWFVGNGIDWSSHSQKLVDDLLPRTPEAHDPDIGLQRNSLFQVRQVERRHVAQKPALACDRKRANRSRSTRRASDRPPRQQRRLLVGAHRVGLLVEHLSQRPRAAAARADAKDDRLVHSRVLPSLCLPEYAGVGRRPRPRARIERRIANPSFALPAPSPVRENPRQPDGP